MNKFFSSKMKQSFFASQMKKFILPSFFILFLSGFILLVFPSKVFSQNQLKDFYTHEFTLEECQKITASLPQDVFSELDANESMPYFCVVGGSGAKEYEQDVELSILNFTISKPTKGDLQKIYSGEQEYIRPGATPFKRADIDVDGGKAIIKTNTFPPNLPNDLSSYYGERAESEVSIFIGDCLFGFAGRSYTNHETYSNYHYSQQDQQGAINAHPNYDHGANSLHKKMVDLTPKVASAVKPFCADTEGSSSPSKKETTREWFNRTFGPLLGNERKQEDQPEEPAGRGIGEFIRKIQSLRLRPGDQTERPQQEVKQEPSKTSSQSVNDWIIENFGLYQTQVEGEEAFPVSLLERTPRVTPDQFPSLSSQARDSLFIPDLNPQAAQKPQVRDPETQQIVDLIKSEVVPGSAIFTGSDSMLIITPSGGVISLQQNGETTILDIQRKTADEKGPKNILVIIKGEAEIKTKDAPIGVETPDAVIRPKGTHYWVSYDPEQRSTIVGVYEGEVEVTPRGNNKSVTISPDGDKPGVVVVSRKLSITKLAVVGLVLAAIIGGIVWFKSVSSQALLIKKRSLVKSAKKR